MAELRYRERYDALDYSIQDVEAAVGAPIALSDDKATVLMGRMREPSLSLHGIEGAFSAAGAKTVIPAKVSGKFSIRCVLSQSNVISFPMTSTLAGLYLTKRRKTLTLS